MLFHYPVQDGSIKPEVFHLLFTVIVAVNIEEVKDRFSRCGQDYFPSFFRPGLCGIHLDQGLPGAEDIRFHMVVAEIPDRGFKAAGFPGGDGCGRIDGLGDQVVIGQCRMQADIRRGIDQVRGQPVDVLAAFSTGKTVPAVPDLDDIPLLLLL
jgi:hypothetical protein